METELLLKLINVVESTSKEVWRVAILQSYIEGFEWITLGMLLILISSIIIIKTKKSTVDEYILMVRAIYVGMLFIIGIILVAISLQYVINPEYHAIELLISIVK